MKKHSTDLSGLPGPTDEELDEIEKQERLLLDSPLDDGEGDILQKYLSAIAKHALLSPDELHRRIVLAQRGHSIARSDVILANLRLVVFVAKRYKKDAHALSFLDLIQCGNLGLLKAIDRFDVSRGRKFSTCAWWWIRSEITGELYKYSRVIRVPEKKIDLYRQFVRVQNTLSMMLGRQAKIKEVAEAMDVSKGTLRELVTTMKKVRHLQDRLSEDEDSDELGSILEDENMPRAEDVLDLRSVSLKLNAVVETLSLLQKEVLVLRYMDNLSNEEIARRLGIRPNKVRAVRKKIEKAFKTSAFSSLFKKYLAERKWV